MPLSHLFRGRRCARAARPAAPRARLLLETLESRLVPYTLSGNAWPYPNLITISFVPDGTNLGGVSSNLFSTFNAKFGSTATWENQILKAAQVWAQQTNLNFAVVPDNGGGTGSGNYQQGDPGMGDIRIGGYNFGDSVLGQAYMPPPVNNYSIAGDITFNTGQSFNIGTTYDLFTVAMHEFGHALGLYGSNTISAAMYETYAGVKSGLSSDDIQGIQAIYGGPRQLDAYAAATAVGNSSVATASNVNGLINLTGLTGVVTGLNLSTAGQKEYFTFTAPVGAGSTLTVQVQSKGLSLLAPKAWVLDSTGQKILASASSTGQYGTTLTLTVPGITAGASYYLEVTGADSSAFSTGAYAFTLNFGSNPTPAVPLPNTQTLNGSPLSSGGGQAVQKAQEFQVNTYTTDIQQTSPQSPHAVAMDADGDFVVTWASHGEDGSGWGIYAQRYNVRGKPQGNEFRVNTTTQDDQLYPNVAMDSTGDFVVTWSSNNQDGNGWGVYAQRYDASGNPLGGEFRVNTTTQDNQMYSDVAMDSVGNFVITWSSHNQDGNGWGIYAQRYDASGNPLGGEFQVNTTTEGDQEYSSIAMDPSGAFVITWSSNGQDGNGWGVYAQRYDAGGNRLGGEFQVNTYMQGDQMYSTAAMDSAGDFVITWSSHNEDGNGWGIYAQQYRADGTPVGGEFRVNTTTQNDQEYSTVAMDPSGNFFVTWSSNNQDGSGWGVYGQQYFASGAPNGNEFQINSTTTGNQQYSSVAVDGYGHAVVVWSGNGPTDPAGVFGQRFDLSGNALTAPATIDAFNPLGDHDEADGDHDEADPASGQTAVESGKPELASEPLALVSHLDSTPVGPGSSQPVTVAAALAPRVAGRSSSVSQDAAVAGTASAGPLLSPEVERGPANTQLGTSSVPARLLLVGTIGSPVDPREASWGEQPEFDEPADLGDAVPDAADPLPALLNPELGKVGPQQAVGALRARACEACFSEVARAGGPGARSASKLLEEGPGTRSDALGAVAVGLVLGGFWAGQVPGANRRRPWERR